MEHTSNRRCVLFISEITRVTHRQPSPGPISGRGRLSRGWMRENEPWNIAFDVIDIGGEVARFKTWFKSNEGSLWGRARLGNWFSNLIESNAASASAVLWMKGRVGFLPLPTVPCVSKKKKNRNAGNLRRSRRNERTNERLNYYPCTHEFPSPHSSTRLNVD